MTNATAAIIATSGKIVAIVHNAEGIPSGTVEYAYNSTTDLSGERVLVNPVYDMKPGPLGLRGKIKSENNNFMSEKFVRMMAKRHYETYHE